MNTSIKSIGETNETFCYVMDLKKEYGSNKVGKENYVLIANLTETQLRDILGEEIKKYEPYAIMTLEMGEAIFESHRNDWKHLKRQQIEFPFDREESLFEEQNPECVQGTDSYTWLISNDCKKIIELALETLTESQRRRVNQHIVENRSITKIATEENVNWKSVKKSINSACVKMRRFIENNGYSEFLGGDKR